MCFQNLVLTILEKAWKKQTEIDSNIKDNEICFITALWNVYPEVFEYDENKLKKSCRWIKRWRSRYHTNVKIFHELYKTKMWFRF